MLYAFGVGEVPISTSGDLEHNGTTIVHTIRAVGAVTNALCAASPGDVVGVRGPFGNAWPIEEAHGRDLVVVGGGVGLPPLRPIVYHALGHRSDFERVVVLYGGRTPDDLLFTRELERWSKQARRRHDRRRGRHEAGRARSASSRSSSRRRRSTRTTAVATSSARRS